MFISTNPHKIDPEKTCFVPVVQGTTMSMLRIYNAKDLDSLEANNKFHIPEPNLYYKDGGDSFLRDDGKYNTKNKKQKTKKSYYLIVAATTGGLDLIIVPGKAK
jgi:hypothetical protein